MKNKILIGILAVIILVGGYWYFNKNANSDAAVLGANPKTYSDSQYKYSFNYPSDFETIGFQGPYFGSRILSGTTLGFAANYFDSAGTVRKDMSFLSFAVSEEATSTCSYVDGQLPVSYGGQAQIVPTKLGANTFESSQSGDCGAGTCRTTYQYNVVKGNLCYRADLVFVYANPGVILNVPDTDPKYKAAVTANGMMLANMKGALDAILGTMKIEK
jgi:hypothetical protein